MQEIDRAAHALLGTPDDASRDEINMKLDTLERLNTRRHVEVLDKLEQLRDLVGKAIAVRPGPVDFQCASGREFATLSA